MSIKLFHKGTGNIQYGVQKEAVIKPGEIVEFPDKDALKLLKLFPKELFDAESFKKSFAEAKSSVSNEPAAKKASDQIAEIAERAAKAKTDTK